MKKYLLFITLFLLFSVNITSSQEWSALSHFSVRNYSNEQIASDFRERFPDLEQATFIMLREYLWEKQEIEYLLKEALHEFSRQPMENKSQTDRNAADNLLANLRIVQQDITSCEYELSRQLSTEYREQKFRTQISIAFTLLIALLLATFFLIIYLRSDLRLPGILLGGTGLQFLSLFVLIIAIILFGILNILEGRELAAILSGISGYILGKGITTEKKDSSGDTDMSTTFNNQNR